MDQKVLRALPIGHPSPLRRRTILMDEPDIELTGTILGPRGGTWHFQPDFMDEAIYVPKSQCTVVPLVGESEGRVTLFVRGWLARKEGWREG